MERVDGMETLSQQTSKANARYGRDEMNLIEFPFGPIKPTEAKTFEIDHFVRDRSTGKPVCRKLVITGSDAFGLPRPIDEQVMIGLKALTQQAGFQSRRVHFSQYQLCKTLGWPPDGRSYRRMESSFDRIAGTTFKFKDSWFDNAEKSWRSHMFHLVDNVELCSENRMNSIRQATRRRKQPLCSFVWNEVVWKSFEDGYIKKLDMEMFRRVAQGRRREVPLRLFRWLDKRFYHDTAVRIDVEKLGKGTLGLSAKYPSEFKRVIKRAAEVLIDCRFMAGCRFRNGKNHEGIDVEFVKTQKRKRPTATRVPNVGTKPLPESAQPDSHQLWIQSKNENELQAAEDRALIAEYGSKLERAAIERDRAIQLPIKESGLIRQQYIRRYLDPGSFEKLDSN